jgi:hypothetical protein
MPPASRYPEITCRSSGSPSADACTTDMLRMTGSENLRG